MWNIFRAKKKRRDKKKCLGLNTDDHTKEEVLAEFKPYEGKTQNGFLYSGYEFDGRKYYGFYYLSEFPDDKPQLYKKL